MVSKRSAVGGLRVDPPVMASVTSWTDVVTSTREPGPIVSSSARVAARNPSLSRLRWGVELNCSPPVTQW